eukprot:367986-Pleurochrysis_carterae.AAC.1
MADISGSTIAVVLCRSRDGCEGVPAGVRREHRARRTVTTFEWRMGVPYCAITIIVDKVHNDEFLFHRT